MSDYQDLQERLGNVIRTKCNTTGCNGCDLKWETGCAATELQGEIMDVEMKDEQARNKEGMI